MNGLRTFVLALSVDSINAALRNAQIKNVPEIDVVPYTFLVANTPYTIPHNLGKKPEFIDWLGEAGSQIYSNSVDKALWTDATVTLRVNVATSGLLKMEAR